MELSLEMDKLSCSADSTLQASYLIAAFLSYDKYTRWIRPLRKHAYSNMLKISPPKTESFQSKISDVFILLLKTEIVVPVRTASTKRF